jgi:hypothetical protein
MVFRQPYAAIRHKCCCRCDYSKTITHKIGLLSKNCFLFINCCSLAGAFTGILVCFYVVLCTFLIKKCNFLIRNDNFYALLSNIS